MDMLARKKFRKLLTDFLEGSNKLGHHKNDRALKSKNQGEIRIGLGFLLYCQWKLRS